MKKTAALILFLIYVNLPLQAQTINVYIDDALYINPNKETDGFIDLKDSLPDGNYVIYNVNRKDENSKKKRIILTGSYLHSNRNGDFIYSDYGINKSIPHAQKAVNYKNGLKDGIEEMFINILIIEKMIYKMMIYYRVYKEGKLDGIYIQFEMGEILRIEEFKDGVSVKLIQNRAYKDFQRLLVPPTRE